MLPILFQDENYVAVHKPSGLLVHHSKLAPRTEACVQILRCQLGQFVYPVHRLDRATSGVLLFGLSPDATQKMQALWQQGAVQKKYWAVVRGHMPGEGLIDHALRIEPDSEPQSARTRYRMLAQTEIGHAVGRYPTARYSLVEFEPLTGRQHQIRKHAHHLSHPIIGDTVYGDGRHNRFFREHFGLHRLLLLATELRFVHPETNAPLVITAPLPAEIGKLLQNLGWNACLGTS